MRKYGIYYLNFLNLRFVSDSTEAEFEHLAATPNNRRGVLPHGSRGFRFGYSQRQCSSKRCFQCGMLNVISEREADNFGICVLTRLYLKKKMKYLLKFQRLHALDLISHEIKLDLYPLTWDLKKSTNLSRDQLNVSSEILYL